MMNEAQKKKEKKAKQRQRRNVIQMKADKNDSEVQNNNTNNDTDILLSESAFVQSVVKQKMKSKDTKADGIIKNYNMKKSNDDTDYMNNANSTSISDDLQGFTTVVRDKGVNKFNYDKTPEGYRQKGYDFILQNKKLLAAHYLSCAIEFDPTDIRHYINRSYCYLNTGDYHSALNDIHRILTRMDNPMKLSQMKCREAQALWGIENYDGATECFKDSLNLMPKCIAVKCESMRMKVVELMSLGFSEREVLELLHDDPNITIKNAVTYLCEFKSQFDNGNIDDAVDDDIYESDNEEYRSNTSLFMEIVGFDYENEDNSWHNQLCTEKNLSKSGRKIKEKQTITNELKVINAAAVHKATTKKPISNSNKKSVWVGHLRPKITESVLKKYFSKFGTVSSVSIRLGKYAFVNFQQASSAQKALENNSIKIGEIVLPIKYATL